MASSEIENLEREIAERYQKLTQLRRDKAPEEVKNYVFKNLEGEVTLLDLFAGKNTLFLIHNMGKRCSYCTLWADGINAFLPHLEDRFAVVLVSKDDPETQRRMANDRGWRFRMASHGGDGYIVEQSVVGASTDPDAANYPGIVCYERQGDKIYRKNGAVFGPGDEFCSLWNIISLAGLDENNWQPKHHYFENS